MLGMGKKKLERKDARVEFRCRESELSEFRERAEEDGFGGNLSAWILWIIRRYLKRESTDRRE